MNIIQINIDNLILHSLDLNFFENNNFKTLEGRYFCLCSTHMFTLAMLNPNFKKILNKSYFTLIDGRPLYWIINTIFKINTIHNRGIDTTERMILLANKYKKKICFYGSEPKTLRKVKKKIKNSYPNLKIINISPPFGEINSTTIDKHIKYINKLEIDILFVALGCPKQELWMAKHASKTKSLVFGVGAAVNYISDDILRPPKILITYGLEWLYRLLQEPKRLFLRYLKYNSIFIYIIIKLIITKKLSFKILSY